LNVSAESPEFDEDTRKWVAGIRSNYPVYIQDDREPENVSLHFIEIKNLGKITFDEKLSVIKQESTPRERCWETIQSLLKSYNDRTERIVVQASADCLVNMPEFRHFFTPIDQIVTALLEHDEVLFDNLLKYRQRRNVNKMLQYINLLENMEIISRKIDQIKTAPQFWLLHKAYEEEIISEKDQKKEIRFDEEAFRRAIIADFIKTRYTALTEVFNIHRADPSIHVDSCIYRPAIEAEEVICLTTKSIQDSYNLTYGKINEYTLANYLRRLRNVDAIEKNGNYWCGKSKLVDKMVELKKDMPMLTPPSI
jgi:hypothetical protein